MYDDGLLGSLHLHAGGHPDGWNNSALFADVGDDCLVLHNEPVFGELKCFLELTPGWNVSSLFSISNLPGMSKNNRGL